MSFLGSDSWGKSLVRELLTHCCPPYGHNCSFHTDIFSPSTSTWVHLSLTICSCDTNIMASLHASLNGAGEGNGGGKCASWHQWHKPRQWWLMAQTGRKKGGHWWLIARCHQCSEAVLSAHGNRINMGFLFLHSCISCFLYGHERMSIAKKPRSQDRNCSIFASVHLQLALLGILQGVRGLLKKWQGGVSGCP